MRAIQSLQARRDGLAEQLATLRASQDDEAAVSISELEGLIGKIDEVLSRAAPKKSKPMKAKPARSTGFAQVFELARVRKTSKAEIRVAINARKAERTVDLRLWFLPEGKTEMVPSRKGVTVSASEVGAMIEALQLARQHLQGGR